MRRSTRVVLGAICLAGLVLVSWTRSLPAEEPAKQAGTVKPPWQRYLLGADAKKVEEQETKLMELVLAGQFPEALKVAETLAELRAKGQGSDHWQAVTARLDVETIRRVLKAPKEEQPGYCRSFTMQREATALGSKGRYGEAERLFVQVLAIRRKLLGEENPDTASALNDVAEYQRAQGKYQQAEQGHRHALAIRRKILGEEHPDTATSYNNLGLTLFAQGKYPQAEETHRKALAIRCKVLGEEDPHLAISYNNIAAVQYVQAKYKEAEEGFRKTSSIYRKVLGEEHPDTATCYNNLGVTLEAQARHREAEEIHRKTLSIRRKVLGEEHLGTAESYNNLALNLNSQAKYKEAEAGFRKALAIYRKLLGEEHPNTATCYNNVAFNLNDQGRYKEAEGDLRKALSIQRKVLGEEHPDTALSYSNVADNLKAQGKYQEAEDGYRKALSIRRKVLGEEHPDTAVSYNDVASIQHIQAKYQQAEEGLRRALAIRRKALGEEHPQTAVSYNNLGMNLNAQGKYPEAEDDVRKALSIRRKVLGEEHPDTAVSYNNVANILFSQGKSQDAEESLRRALAIRRKMLGEEHPDTAASYNNLAMNLHRQAKYKEAEEGLRKALSLYGKLLGEEHPNIAQCYSNLAVNLNAQGNYKEAEVFFLRAADSFAKARVHVAATGLERAAFSSEHSPLLGLTAVLARNGKPDEAWQRFEESLGRGTWDDLSARLRRPQADRDKQTQITARIDRLNQRLAKMDTAELPQEQRKQRDELLSQLRQAYDELANFTQQLEQKYGPIAGQIFSSAQIQASLPADAALVAWLDIPGQRKAADPNGEHWAILLRSTGSPKWIRLVGSGTDNAWTKADTLLPFRLRAALQKTPGDWQPLAQRLRQQRLDPLAPYLQGVQHLIVLPSANMAGVPVEVIADRYTVSYAPSGTMYAHLLRQPSPTGKGLFALADPVFDALTGKDKLPPLPPSGVLVTMVLPGSHAAKAGLKANDVLLRYGDKDLDSPKDFKPQPESDDPDKRVPVVVWREGKTLKRQVPPGKLGVGIAREPAPQAVAEQRRMNRLLASRSGDDGNWPRLPGTRIEAASLQRLFGNDSSQLLLDSDASEQHLHELAQRGELGKYRYLHFATHGEVNDVFPLRSAVILSRDHLPDEKQRDELLASGRMIPNGRLTAEEALAHWNLHCDLVTLSACQTALGKYEDGEGFVGFAQSLILCGTRSVCLSLWKVDDTATALLMERFYQNLLGKREGLDKPMTKAAALAEAKAWLRDLPREQAIKHAAFLSNGVDRGKRPALPPLEVAPTSAPEATEKNERPFAHPYYWAAFVLVGHAD